MSQERERVKKLVAALSELVNSVYVIKQPGESSPRIVVSNNALGKARRALPCSCGGQENLGFEADPIDAVRSAAEHLGISPDEYCARGLAEVKR